MSHKPSPRPIEAPRPGKVVSLADWKLAKALREAEAAGADGPHDPWPWAYTFSPPRR